MNCILCGVETEGSTGAAGIFWPCLCQPCKDREDQALADSVVLSAKRLETAKKLIKAIVK